MMHEYRAKVTSVYDGYGLELLQKGILCFMQ